MAAIRGAPAQRSALRHVAWSVPEWPWIVLVSIAWTVVAGHVAHEANLGYWLVMVVAMMLPATLPIARAVAFESLWARRYRAPAIFLATYLAIWGAFGAAALGAWSLSGAGDAIEPAAAGAAMLLVGSGWLLTGRHNRFLRRSHRRLPIRARGHAADCSCLRFGAYHARQCIGTCWPLMLAMVPAHRPVLMVPVAALSTWERLAGEPRRRACAGALAVLAVAALVL